MNTEELTKYWLPARNKVAKSTNLIASQELAVLLGIAYPHANYWEFIELTDKLRNQLVALAGPHSATVIQIMKVRRSTPCPENESNPATSNLENS